MKTQRFVLALLLALAASSGAALLPGCDDGEGGAGGDDGGQGGGGGAPSSELCDNGIDDDANGQIDCLDAGCAADESCRIGGNECSAQIPDCEGDLNGSINQICAGGTCAAAGPIQPDATLRRGNVIVQNQLDGVRPDLVRSFLVRVYHPSRPDGSTLTCADLAAMADREDPAQVNVILRVTGGVSQQGATIAAPAFGAPVSEEGQPFLVHTTFYSADRDTLTAEPRGEFVGLGCEQGVVIPEGEYVQDEAHTVGVAVKPICDPANDTCPAPKTCLVGARICRDQRCEPACQSIAACRDVGNGPECLRKCDPSDPQCANLERCDATEGEPSVCVPVE